MLIPFVDFIPLEASAAEATEYVDCGIDAEKNEWQQWAIRKFQI